jgi:hypothetical protein
MYFSQQEVDAFWEQLTPDWNRRPALIRKPFSKPFLDQRDFLGFLQTWAQEARDGKRGSDVQMIDADALPRPEDETLAAFEARIAATWTRDWYLYIPDGIQKYDGAVWERAIELLMPALRLHGGLPAGGMMLDLFYGKYGSTPTGIHLDSSDNLAFVVRGPKRLMFWAPDRFTAKFASPPKHPSHQQSLTGRFEDCLDSATVIDADAGDIVYWPKDYWHIGVSPGQWSGMVSLPMWWSASPAKLARAMLNGVLDLQGEPELYAVNLDDLASVASEMPASLSAVVAEVKAQVTRRYDVAAKFSWAKFVTAYGFSTPPSPRQAPGETAGRRVRVVHPIVAVDLGKAVGVIGCGHQMVSRCMGLMPVVSRLRVGSEHAVRDLESVLPLVEDESRAELDKMLRELHAFRALDVI